MIDTGIWEKMEARADLAADKLTTSTGYSRKVEFSDNFAGLRRHTLAGNRKSRDQKHERR